MNSSDVALIGCALQSHGAFFALDAAAVAVHALLVLPHLVVVDKVGITLVTGVVAHFEVDHPDVVLDINNQPSAFHIRANGSDLTMVPFWVSSFHVVDQSSHLRTQKVKEY